MKRLLFPVVNNLYNLESVPFSSLVSVNVLSATDIGTKW